MLRLTGLLAYLTLATALQAQTIPQSCEVFRECEGESCQDTSGTVLMFEATPEGLVAWDSAVPNQRVALTTIPGPGPDAWFGRARDLDAAVLMTRFGQSRIAVTMHVDGDDIVFTALGRCRFASDAPALTKDR